MAKRILTWHHAGKLGNETRIGPTFYMEGDYEPVAVRIYAETAPNVEDAEFDIKDDGVSIFLDRAVTFVDSYNRDTRGASVTTLVLAKGENYEENAEDFTGANIEKGSWVYCTLVKDGNGKNFTVQLEMEQISDDEESEE